MSNPFLADLEEQHTGSYTPAYTASGYSTPFSGAATPLKRRNSTNPFELSPEEEENPIMKKLDQVYQEQQHQQHEDADRERNGANATSTVTSVTNSGNVASAIADMTADFCQSISMKEYDFGETTEENNRDVSGMQPPPPPPPPMSDDYDEMIDKPISTVKTIEFDNNGAIFDPFETIHDEDGHSSKRSSMEVTSATETNTSQLHSQQQESEHQGSPLSKSAKAKELFNSSMASFEILAAATAPEPHHEGEVEDISPTQPPTSIGFLSTPAKDDLYNSDLSDLSDVSPTTGIAPPPPTQATSQDSRSAFDSYSGVEKQEEPISSQQGEEGEDDDDLPPPPPPMESESRPATFDPFATVLSESTITNDENTDVESYRTNNEMNDSRPRIGSITGAESVDIHHTGNPNADAEGVENDAYTGDEDRARKCSIDVVQVETDNIQPNDLRQLVEADVKVDDGGDNEQDNADDPFDTTNFDSEAFDAFDSKFKATSLNECTTDGTSTVDPFASPYRTRKLDDNTKDGGSGDGFDTFQPFELPKQPENTPFKARKKKKDSFEDSDDDDDDDDDSEEEHIKIVIRNKKDRPTGDSENFVVPLLPPPPKSPRREPKSLKLDDDDDESLDPELRILTGYKTKIKKKTGKSFLDDEFDRFFSGDNRTAESGEPESAEQGEEEWPTAFGDASKRTAHKGSDSPMSPQTPLYDEDTSQPLEDFPPRYVGDGWDMMLRYPPKKKLTANRCWKKIFVRFIPETGVLQLFNKRGDPQPFQEQPIQASYSLSEISPQQYDQYGKIFTIKVQYVFYRERVGVRPGQIAKVMQGQIQSMGDFARLGMPVEHAPQISELLKIGSLEYFDLKQLVTQVEEAMFRMSVHRDRALTYRTEEIQCVVQDELYVEQNKMGLIEKQLARVRCFFLGFLNGVPEIDVGVNDLRRQGREVVGRHDILPVVTEEWIRVEKPEFHACVQPEEFEKTQVVKLIPPDACHFELMRFRIRPPKNRELPLQVSANMNITPSKMELKCDILVPGCISRKHGQIPCEEIIIRFHIPECWIYFFRVEKHFRMGAVHSTNRRSGKLKGFERILGATANPEPQLIEVTAGQAKYEHAYHSIVWRIPRLPKEGQGAYTQQLMVVRLPLGSFDRIPESFYDYVHVEFTMPSTTVSHTTLRSISVNCETPPEKFVRYISKYEYKIGLSITYDDTKPELEYQSAVSSYNGANRSSSSSSKQAVEAHSSDEENNND